MLFNLLALLALIALIATGVAMIVRALLERPPGSNTSCAACGHDAADLVDFKCPGCGHDVRDAGLTSRPADSAVARFWRAVAITCLAVAAFGLASSLAYLLIPTMRFHDVTVSLQPNFKTAIESIDMQFDGVSRGDGDGTAEQIVRGRFVADLAVADGRMTTLDVRFPDAAARITGENGTSTAEQPLSEAAVRQWLDAAGVDTQSAEGDSAVRELQGRIERIGRGWRAGDAEHEQMRSRSLFSGGRGASSYERLPAWLAPILSIAWGILWLLALRRWLRRRVAAHRGRSSRDSSALRQPQTAVPA